MKKERILAIIPTYYPQCGGAEKAAYELYAGISKECHVDLLCPDYGGKKEEFNGFFKIHRVCKTTKNLPFKVIKYQLFQFLKGCSLMRKEKYDLIHCHYTLLSGIAGVLLKKRFKVPLVITENHFGSGLEICREEDNPRFLLPIMRSIAKNADLLVSISKSQDMFLDSLGKGKLRYETIHLGGDCKVSGVSKEKLQKSLKIPAGKKIIFSVSRLVKRKNYDELIRAANEVCKRRKDFVFLIGGKGPEFDTLAELIKKYDLEDHVKLLGFLYESDLEKYRKISDVFVSTSDYEGAGVIYFEAFAAKMPLFAKRNEASEEAISDGRNGKLFDNYHELARMLTTYLDDKKKMESLSKNGYKSFCDEYNWKRYCDSYKKAFARTIETCKKKDKAEKDTVKRR